MAGERGSINGISDFLILKNKYLQIRNIDRIILRNMSLYYFIYIFLITIMNDTFAHSVGTLFGKHKINEISPNKSWEGCLGGAFFGVLISVLFYLIFITWWHVR